MITLPLVAEFISEHHDQVMVTVLVIMIHKTIRTMRAHVSGALHWSCPQPDRSTFLAQRCCSVGSVHRLCTLHRAHGALVASVHCFDSPNAARVYFRTIKYNRQAGTVIHTNSKPWCGEYKARGRL